MRGSHLFEGLLIAKLSNIVQFSLAKLPYKCRQGSEALHLLGPLIDCTSLLLGWDPGHNKDGGQILDDIWALNVSDYSWKRVATQVHSLTLPASNSSMVIAMCQAQPIFFLTLSLLTERTWRDIVSTL